MNRINDAVHEIHHLDNVAAQDQWLNRIHPLPKLLVTICYISCITSFHKYNFTGTLSMALYPILLMTAGNVTWKSAWKGMKIVLLLACMVGIANPILDRTVLGNIGNISVTGGMISMMTLMMKGVFSVCASYILIVTTSVEDICSALRMLHISKMIVTMAMLIYRYIIVLLKETQRITTAYALRAPGQKGIHFKAWGPLLGQLLLRSIDRAQIVYESMILRGYDGTFFIRKKKKMGKGDMGYLCFWLGLIFVLRLIPVFEIIGKLFLS